MKLPALILRLKRVAQTTPQYSKPLTLAEAAARPERLLETSTAFEHVPLESQIDINVQALQAIWGGQDDIIVRPVNAGGRRFAFVYLKGIVDEHRLEIDGISRLTEVRGAAFEQIALADIGRQVLTNLKSDRVHKLDEAVRALTRGSALLLAEHEAGAVALAAELRPSRGVTSPPNEAVVRGPHEGFTEALDVNVAMLRSRLRTPLLRFENYTLGRISQTPVKIAYLQGLPREETLGELRERLGRIDIDAVLESNYIEELIEDTPYTVFPTVWGSERPDAVSAQLLEGGVAILTDGSPYVLSVPTTLWAFLQSSEDYYQRFDASSFIRMMRIIMVFVAAFLPAVYVALLLFHPEALPAPLLLQIAATAEQTPLPTVAEMFLMLLAFDVLREAGLRLPKVIGQTIGIVGGLFVGQMSVQAGLVTPTIIIVAALSAISSFLIPHYSLSNAVRLVRYFTLTVASTLGLFGVLLSALMILGHLSWLRSLGLPYLWPALPSDLEFTKDVFIRVPWWRMLRRPITARPSGSYREGFPLRPHRDETMRRPTSEGSEGP